MPEARSLIVEDFGVVMPPVPQPPTDCSKSGMCFVPGVPLELILQGAQQDTNDGVVDIEFLRFNCPGEGLGACNIVDCSVTQGGFPLQCEPFLVAPINCNPGLDKGEVDTWEVGVFAPVVGYASFWRKPFGGCPDGFYTPDPGVPGIPGELGITYL